MQCSSIYPCPLEYVGINILNEISKSISIILPDNKVSINRHGSDNCSEIYVYSKNLIQLFPQHDTGKKHERQIILKDWQKEVLDKKLDFYPADRQFTTTHDLEPVGDEVSFEGDFEDPHLLPTQKNHEWTTDTEESSGTYDDYNAYKGIVD